ncbi:2310_t:CDS:1, partial [Gigaspora margarita]
MKFLQTSSLFVFVFVTFNFVSSQQIPTNLSSTCLTELIKLSGNSELNSCASFTKLAQLQNTTNPKPILDSYCSAPKCNDNTTSTAATELKSQCATDLAAKDPIVTTVKTILVFNSPLKDSLCFKNSSGGYCDMDPNSQEILSYIGGANATPPTDINCNDCNKAILNTFVNYFKQHPESTTELSTDPKSLENLVTTKCGASFL